MTIDLQARQIQPLRHTFDRVAQYTGDKPASRYLEATLGTQPTENFHYRPTWEAGFELYDTGRTAIKMADWDALRDPRQLYYATWTGARARQQETMEANYQFVDSRRLIEKIPAALREHACAILMPLRHVAWGGNMNNCTICARGYGTTLTAPVLMHALDHLGAAQYLTRLGLALEGPEILQTGRQQWLHAPVWQPLRRLLENTLVQQDPMELFVAQNLALDGLLYPLIYDSYVDDHLAIQGATAIAMLTTFMPEWHAESNRWVDAVIKITAAESDDNRHCLSRWYHQHTHTTRSALLPIARAALGEHGTGILDEISEKLDARARTLGLSMTEATA